MTSANKRYILWSEQKKRSKQKSFQTFQVQSLTKDEITVALENGYLTVSAAKGIEKDTAENEEEKQKGNYIRRERYSGSCQRCFYVGEVLTVDDVKANFQHGILTLTIPKKDAKKIADNKYIAIEG